MPPEMPLELAADSDLTHLFDLLAMLPGPTEDRDFWLAVQRNVLPDEDRLGYVYEKMSTITRVIQEPDPDRIAHLAKYLLIFFSGSNPDLWKILNRVTAANFSLSMTNDHGGRWWAEDVCRTAWALYVRYRNYGNDQWKDKWRLNPRWDWPQWLPGREDTAD